MTYEFTARGKQGLERPQLMSRWTLVGFAVVVMIPLVLIFPKQELLRQASQQKLGDVLTVNYLTNLLKADSGNLELRVLLAEHKIHLKEMEEVPPLIEPVIRSEDPAWQAKGLLAEYKLITGQYLWGDLNPSQRAALRIKRISAFQKLARLAWPLATTVYLAGQADQLHEHGISVLLYLIIAESSATMSTSWFAETAAAELADGNYELAAHLYFIARHKEYLLAKQREYLLAGVHALMSGNLFVKAMEDSERHLGNLSDDPETLYVLIQAARAANDQPRAVHYAKLLLRLSWLGDVVAWFQRLDLGLIGISNADAASDSEPAGPDGIRPYDAKHYELAYQVFIENHNLQEAYRVAEAAVDQVSEETIWHKRLAQVAEWLGKPEVALREWRRFLQHSGSREALLAVLRLAPSLNDYDALLDAWTRVPDRQKMDEKQWRNLGDLFEQAGRPRDGIRYFEQRYGIEKYPLQLEIAARLAERSGDDERAKALYFRLIKAHGNRPEWLLMIANLYLRKGDYRKAYDLLEANRDKAAGEDLAYWKLLADLAWELQLDNDAKKSYRQLEKLGKLALGDFSRLIYLLPDSRHEEKAALAELAYQRFGDRDMLLLALEIYAAKGDVLAQRRLFESAAADGKLDLSGSSRFYLLRAQFFQANGDFQSARTDFRRTAGIAPGSVSSGTAMLWFLIDGHDLSALRELTEQIVARGDHENPAYWGALAAAYQVLDQPARAVAYYTRQLKQGGQDFLWLVNYADALEQDRQPGMAWRVRSHAWLQLRETLSNKPFMPPYLQDMQAAARLALLNYPGDPGLALVRSMLRQDRLLEHDAVENRMTNELALAWAVSKEQSANAKAWLWRRYGENLNHPLWAETAVAMAENDTVRLEKLLAEQADGMSMLVRHDVANLVGQESYAQSIVYEGLRDAPGNDEAQQRLTEDVLAAAGFVDVELRNEQLGTLHDTTQSTRVEQAVAPHLRLGAEFWKSRQSNDTTPAFGSVPPSEKVAGILLKNHSGFGDTEILLRRRNEYANTTESHVNHAMNVQQRLNLQLGLEFNAAATESNDLRVFGMRDQFSAGLLYRLSKREYVQIQPVWARYFTQSGEFLGSGNHVSWEVGHLIRTESPDLKVRLIGIHTGFRSEATALLALPGNVNIYGVCVGVGDSYRYVYSQAWHPHADYCATHNDLSGQGYNAGLGLAGSVAGHDRLSLSWRQESGGANVINGLSRELKLSYRYFY